MPVKAKVPPAVAAWREKNPLHKWLASEKRKDNGETIITLALKLHAARQTLYTWLYGDNLPMHNQFVALKRLCGVDFYQWMLWLERKPQTRGTKAQGGDADAQAPN